MTFLKLLLLLLIVLPFALFLLYITDKLMDELPKGASHDEDKGRVDAPRHVKADRRKRLTAKKKKELRKERKSRWERSGKKK